MTTILPPPIRPLLRRPDALGVALHVLRMDGVFYCHATARGNWSMAMPAIPAALSFHVLTSGECWLVVEEGAPPVHLRAGSVALVPHGRGHLICSEPGAEPIERVERLPQEYLAENYSVLEYGEEGATSTLICGVVAFDGPATRRLVDLLPSVLTTHSGHLADHGWITDVVRMIAAELRQPQPGGEAVTVRLADILIIQLIREWLRGPDAQAKGWLLALQDEQLGPVLAAVHHAPGHGWTLEELAAEAAMSRSAFAARFTDVVGEPPMQYVTAWRMQAALRLLDDRSRTVASVAEELGYRSVAAFSRAFKRVVGQAPATARAERLGRP